MADAVINDLSILEYIRASLTDKSTTDFDVLDEDVYYSFILKNLLPESTYIFQKMTDGVYTYDTDGLGYHNHFFNMSFTGEDDMVYTSYCTGSIRATTGTPTVANIEVTACQCDYGLTMAGILEHLAVNYAREISQSSGDTNITPGSVRKDLLHMASIVQGVRSI